jgi:hypothetical protein
MGIWMKVFVATGSGNRLLVGNLTRAIDGELVWLYRNDEPCAECGTKWAVSGLASGKAAPRFTVVDRTDLTLEDYASLVAGTYLRRGLPLPKGWEKRMANWILTLVAMADRFEAGEELSFVGGRLQRRALPGAG